MIEREVTVTHTVVCDECGSYGETGDNADEARRAGVEHTDARRFHYIDGRDVCHDCTPEGRAENRERWVRLAQKAWGYDGIDPYTTARVAGAMFDRGEYPPPEVPWDLVRAER